MFFFINTHDLSYWLHQINQMIIEMVNFKFVSKKKKRYCSLGPHTLIFDCNIFGTESKR